MTAAPESPLEALKQRFVARCVLDLAQLELFGAGGEVSLEDLRFLVHRLAGAAGVFGYAGVSAIAAELETVLLEHPARAALPIGPLIAALKTMLHREESLRRAAG